VEFCFFIVIITLVAGAVYWIGLKISFFFQAWKKKLDRKQARPLKKSPNLFWIIELLIGIFLILIGAVYLSRIDVIWSEIGFKVNGLYQTTDWLKGKRLWDVYLVAQFFRGVYPSFFAVVLLVFFSFIKGRYPLTVLIRFIKGFDHKQIFITLSFWCFYIALEFFLPGGKWYLLKMVILNCSVFLSAYYFFYGFFILVFMLRKRRLDFSMILILLYSLIVFSGPVFMFPLLIIAGVGISDIWMNYRKNSLRNGFNER